MRILIAMVLLAAISSLRAEIKYQNDFERSEAGSVPEEFLIQDGEFEVKEEGGNKFLELPGAPLDSFGFLFGPNAKENVSVSARIFGTSSGRRFPVFEVGLNGLGGYKLRVSPGKKQIELYRGEMLKTNAPLARWESGKWSHLKLQVLKAGENQWRIEGKFWQEGSREPNEPILVFTDSQAPLSARASVGGMPYAGTPIRFDDLIVADAGKQE